MVTYTNTEQRYELVNLSIRITTIHERDYIMRGKYKNKGRKKPDPLNQELAEILSQSEPVPTPVPVPTPMPEPELQDQVLVVQAHYPTPVLEPEPTPKLTNKALAAANAWLKERGFH